MARYAYDVNKTQRYIDVHKQFQGGLKTVDTDDALGAVFLRDAENVSLSEFGFIEKRYGTYENFKVGLNITENSYLQGYWEFLNKYIVVALDGKLYYQFLESPESTFTEFTQFNTKEDLNYPNGLAAYLGLNSDFSVGSGFTGFQNTRLMGAVNLANVLYIFTGKYPVYILEEEGELKAYLFSKEDPTYAELVVTGHNLLENDYDDLYYTGVDDISPIVISENIETENDFILKEANFFPRIPYAKDGTIDFKISYDLKPSLIENFDFNVDTRPDSLLNTISLESLKYRPSGVGASDLDFLTLDPLNYEANVLNNAGEDIRQSINVLDEPFEGLTPILTEGSLQTYNIKEQYWTNVLNNESFYTDRLLKLDYVGNNLVAVDYRDIQIDIEDIPLNLLETGKKIGFSIRQGGTALDIETTRANARNAINSYGLSDSRENELIPDVRIVGGVFIYSLFYSNSQTLIPIFSRKFVGNNQNGVGDARLEYSFVGSSFDNIQVSLYNADGVLIPNSTTLLKYVKPGQAADASDLELLKYSTLRKLLAMSNEERSSLVALSSKLNQGTTIELFEQTNSPETDILLKKYTLGTSPDISFEENYYSITLPELNPTAGSTYYLRYKTVDVRTRSNLNQTNFIGQGLDPDIFYYTPTDELYSITEIEDIKYFYPNVFQITAAVNSNSINYTQLNYYLHDVVNVYVLSSEDDIGVSLLNVKILKGLLSGTFDFEFKYRLTRQNLNYISGELESSLDSQVSTFIVKDITITEEKLDDYTFFQGDRAHPIWSCNNVIEHFGKLMVWGSTQMPTALFYSFPDRPFYFPSFFYLDFTNEYNQPLVNVTPFMNILVAQTEDQTWGIRGNSGLVDAPSPYVEFSINNTVGTIAPKSVRPVRNHLFFLSKQGVIALKSLYAADEQYNIDFVDRNIRNIVPQDSDAVGIQFDNQYWLNFPERRITLRWYIDKKAWVKDVYSVWNNFRGVFKYQIKNGKLEFITKPSDFDSGEFIYKIGVDYSLPYDLGKTYNASFETSFLNQNYPFHHKNYKEFKYDFTIQNEYNPSREPLYKTDTLTIVEESTHTFTQLNLEKNHKYLLSFDSQLPIESAQLGEQTISISGVSLNTDTELITDYEFMVDNDITDLNNLTIFFSENVNYGGPASLSDITYSESLEFLTKLISEENNVLNQEEEVGYEEQDSVISIDLEDFKGFTLGKSSFGDRVTLIKTVKLSGRGYNLKAYFEDYSNSKWTIESMGITYKMRKARSR